MIVERRKPLHARIGVVAVGHHTYWDQFDGLLDELMGKMQVFVDRVAAEDVTVETFGMLDCAEASYAALPRIKAADLDLLFIDMVTYATSSTFGALIRELHIPVVLVALQPLKAMDYARGTTYMQLCNDDFCSVPEFTGVALRMGRPAPHVILGTLYDDPEADAEISRWCSIARVLHDLRRARLGHMGHVLESMLDMHTDPTAITSTFGAHVVQCEPDELLVPYREAGATEVAAMREQISSFFDTPDPISDPLTSRLSDRDLENAARVAVALNHFVDSRNLDGLAYYYEAETGSDLRKLVTNLIVGNSLLCAAGFPMCGEYDIKTCVAMLIMDRLQIGGSFAEFHPIDFERDSVLVGHDGPHHINIAEGKPILRSLSQFHGKPGSGASVEFHIKEGPITMLSIGVTATGAFKFVIAEGESINGPIPPTGNTNTHGRFQPDVRTFLNKWVAEGPTHHFALGIGHHADTIARIAECLGVEHVVVT
jgi:L-arabinose isomerase